MLEPSSAIFPPGGWGALKPPCGTPIDRSHPLGGRTIAAFLFNEQSGGVARDSVAGIVASPSSGVTWSCENAGRAWQFGGSPDYAAVPLNLSPFTVISVEFRLWWNAYTGGDSLALEYSADSNVRNAFYVNPSCGLGTFRVMMTAGGGSYISRAADFTRPSAAAWHHYVAVLDRANQTVTPYVDGKAVSYVLSANGTFPNAAFGNYSLYLMSRGGTALYGAGRMSLLRFYAGALNASDVRTLFNQPYCTYQGGAASAQACGTGRPLIDGSLTADSQLLGAVA